MKARERKVPIHTVGIGDEEGIPDIELVKVDVPRTAEEDFPVEITATVKRTGNAQKKATTLARCLSVPSGAKWKCYPIPGDSRASVHLRSNSFPAAKSCPTRAHFHTPRCARP